MNDLVHEQSTEGLGPLALALSKAQGELETVTKDKTAKVPIKDSGRSYTFTYANLASVLEQIRPVLAANELALTQAVGQGGVLVTQVTHSGGGWVRSNFTLAALPDKYGKVTPQGIGSAITYARRYALCALLGIATDDDDGKAARGSDEAPTRAPEPISNRPKLVMAFAQVGVHAAALEKYIGHTLLEITDDEEQDLVLWGTMLREGGDAEAEARLHICGPSPAQKLQAEFKLGGGGGD